MAMAEIESFLVKFQNLWRSGCDATLTVDAHAGQASVSLKVGLGKAPFLKPAPFPFRSQKNQNGPSRQRRRAKREAFRLNAVEADKAQVEDTEAAAGEEADNVSSKVEVTEKATKNESLVTDEFCSDEIYVDQNEVTEEAAGKSRYDVKLWKIVGKFKNPTTKSWTPLDPEMDCKLLWKQIEEWDEKFGMKEIGEGSSYSENHIEFWGTWKVKKNETDEEFLKNSKNWPRGIEILEVKPG